MDGKNKRRFIKRGKLMVGMKKPADSSVNSHNGKEINLNCYNVK